MDPERPATKPSWGDETLRTEMAALFEDLLQSVWNHLVPVLGETAAAAIFTSARNEAADTHPLLASVAFDNKGPDLSRYRQRAMDAEPATIRWSIVALVESIVSLITDLTGDVFTDSLATITTCRLPGLKDTE